MSDEVLRGGFIMLHPERRKIINTLKAAHGEPLFIGEIASTTGIDRRLISYHLSTLEDSGFVKSEFKIIEQPHSKGKAGRFYQLTPKVDSVMEEFIKVISKKP